ncbi:MAG TPA: CPBP family glutamic-type intramembrane protease [Myxococcota bacterium]|nr:CPBP family glutamic-type intramembrane protease [Myxococcota bacterium]
MPAAPGSPLSLLWPYALPYLLYVAIGSFVDLRTHAELVYAARAVVVGGALVFFRRRYLPLRGPRSAAASAVVGAGVGLLATPAWVLVCAAVAQKPDLAWGDSAWAARALGSTVLPPLVEELLFRGWALGTGVLLAFARAAGSADAFSEALERRSLSEVPSGAWAPLALCASSALFAAGHEPGQWPAAFGYGLLMCGLWIARGDLVSCISAHAVTNAALALYVRASGHWGAW